MSDRAATWGSNVSTAGNIVVTDPDGIHVMDSGVASVNLAVQGVPLTSAILFNHTQLTDAVLDTVDTSVVTASDADGELIYDSFLGQVRFGATTAWYSLLSGLDIPGGSTSPYLATNSSTGYGIVRLVADSISISGVAVCTASDTRLNQGWRRFVRVASTADVASISGLLTIDGVTVVANDRVLLKDQATPSQNGIWAAAAGAWTRAVDCNADIMNRQAEVWVASGTINADTSWHNTNATLITVGTTAQTWELSKANVGNPGGILPVLNGGTGTAGTGLTAPAGFTLATTGVNSMTFTASDTVGFTTGANKNFSVTPGGSGTVECVGTTRVTGDLKLTTAGNGLYVKEGANATMGRAVLVAGTVTVSTTKVTTTCEIFLQHRIKSGTVGVVTVGTVSAGTSFVINSEIVTDTSTISWLIVEAA